MWLDLFAVVYLLVTYPVGHRLWNFTNAGFDLPAEKCPICQIMLGYLTLCTVGVGVVAAAMQLLL